MENNSFENAIKSYLDERAKADELFAKSYVKSNKSLKECCDYIVGEALKSSANFATSIKACQTDDDVVFGLAVHYFDEDDIKVSKLPANVKSSVSKPSTSVAPTEEEKTQARQAALKRLEEEQYALLKKKPAKPKKEVTEVQQMSLF